MQLTGLKIKDLLSDFKETFIAGSQTIKTHKNY
jgi:hypothetical protein